MPAIILENEKFSLAISSDGKAESLILKSNNTELLSKTEPLPFFTLTEERPYNNEIKLAHPNKRTTFKANRVRYEDGKLIVGFELIEFEAVVDVKIAPRYITFTLVDFITPDDVYGIGVLPIELPVYEFRLVQLPLIHRERFGEWLNVMWDDTAAVNVLAACPYPRIESEEHKDYRILYGETLRDVKLKDAGVALIVSAPDELLDGIDALERDYGLPLGVESRRSGLLNSSKMCAVNLRPDNVDKFIENAKRCGLKFMKIYYPDVLALTYSYRTTGEYDTFREEYVNGYDSLVEMLDKIRAAGIIPGLHILQTHIGLDSHYLTPVADHRLNKTKLFTMSKPIGTDDTEIYVEENPEGSPKYEKLRVLTFMGELISYESFTTERPYKFTGCKRGFNSTTVKAHDIGTIGGILDLSEFGANSAYIDQRTSLQDEVAANIAHLYDAGFGFFYFDGSEGAIPPYEIYVALSQLKVYEKTKNKPIFCEGAAKSHFSWHMLSGGNAFDVWPTKIFKQMIVKHPFAEAQRMANDFTRVDFGWWSSRPDLRPDMYEYATALAASWDCPGSLAADTEAFDKYPRFDDILEVLRRWELARETGFITDEIKKELHKTDIEHTLLINEQGDLELVACEEIKNAANGDERVTAFVFERAGKTYVSCWNNYGSVKISLPISGNVSYVRDLGGEETPTERDGDKLILPLDSKKYLITELAKDELIKALELAKII